MARRIRLAMHLSVAELEHRYRAAHEPHERTWWQIVWLLARGQLAKEIAESTGYTASWIGQIAKRYNAEGPAGMVNRQRTTSWRAPRMLSAQQQEELRAALAGPLPRSGPGTICNGSNTASRCPGRGTRWPRLTSRMLSKKLGWQSQLDRQA